MDDEFTGLYLSWECAECDGLLLRWDGDGDPYLSVDGCGDGFGFGYGDGDGDGGGDGWGRGDVDWTVPSDCDIEDDGSCFGGGRALVFGIGDCYV